MFDSPEIQNLLEKIRSAGETDLIQVGTLAAFIARASGIKGIDLGFKAVPILNKILAMDCVGNVTFLHPQTKIPYDSHDWDELSGDWLVYRDVAIEIVERLYRQRGQVPLPVPESLQRPDSITSAAPENLQPPNRLSTQAENDGAASKYRQKRQLQEAAILNWLKAKNYDPKRLPKWKYNAPGVKAEARPEMIKDASLFTENTFDDAWERLLKDKSIGYAANE